MTLLEEIQSAQPGSDIYELVNKIAYSLNQKYPSKKDTANLKNARTMLENFAKDRIPKQRGVPLELYLKDFLQTSAFLESQKYKERTSFDNWIDSINSLGKFIAKNYKS